MPRPFASALQLAFVVFAAVLVYGFVAMAREGETRRKCSAICLMQPSYAGAERVLPHFTLSDLDGKVHDSQEWAGKVVVLNFWTKTCGPCLEEMPSFAELAKVLYPYKDVAVVAVSTDDDAKDTRATLKSILREPPAFTSLVDPDGDVVRGKFGTDLFPETWIIDEQGIVRARFDGARDWSNSVVPEEVLEIKNGGYCPLSIRQGKLSANADAVHLCQTVSGGDEE